MKADSIREKFTEFFKRCGHKQYPSSSLIPNEEDQSVLFTTAGMQQFKKWYIDEDKIKNSRVVSVQKCFRTSDIDEVGDKTHHTFFEMLGNFSFGYPDRKNSYFKKEAIDLAWQFLTNNKWLGIDKGKISATIFKGDEDTPNDKESKKILENIGVSKIEELGREDNFWGPVGKTGPCGPTVEFFVPGKEEPIEIWNLVFNQYNRRENGNLDKLGFQGVDTGMGLERVAAYLQNTEDDYEIDLFKPIIKKIEEVSGKKYKDHPKIFRIIADHVKGSVFLINEGIKPSNNGRGYVLRKLIRQSLDNLFNKLDIGNNLPKLPLDLIFLIYRHYDFHISKQEIIKIYENELIMIVESYKKRVAANKRMAILDRYINGGLDLSSGNADSKWLKDAGIRQNDPPSLAAGKFAYKLWHTYRYSKDIFVKKFSEKYDYDLNIESFDEGYKKGKEIFRSKSRQGVNKKFKGGLADREEVTVKLHTAAHLLHEALRRVLGKHVEQRGQNITGERLRFDFSHPQAMTEDELKKVEDMVNSQIEKGLEIISQDVSLDEAIDAGAVALFRDKYPDIVTLYSIGDFSNELCLGPHVDNTAKLGKFKIVKEESSSKGVRRIRAILE